MTKLIYLFFALTFTISSNLSAADTRSSHLSAAVLKGACAIATAISAYKCCLVINQFKGTQNDEIKSKLFISFTPWLCVAGITSLYASWQLAKSTKESWQKAFPKGRPVEKE